MSMEPDRNGLSPMQRAALPEFFDHEGHLCLRGEAYWKFRALQAEADKVTSQIAYTSREIELLIAQVPGLKELFGQKNELMRASSQAAKDLHDFNTWLQDKLGIDLSKCGIDDKTGRIHLPETNHNDSEDERSAGSASA